MHAVKRIMLPVLTAALLVTACSAPLVPDPAPSRDPRIARSEYHTVLADLEADWNTLWNRRATAEARRGALTRYNRNLRELLTQWRYRMDREGKLPKDLLITHGGTMDLEEIVALYDDILPAADVPEDELKEHYTVDGLGVPMVGIIPPEKIKGTDRRFAVRSTGTVSTLTAVLSFPKGKKPHLDFLLRQRQETYRHAGQEYRLAADFSAPIELYWNLTGIKKHRWLGLLRPQELRNTTGLCSMEGYNPAKIPVILTHGLASSAATFNNLVNRLMADPDIRNRYQFWYFNYPSGTAWTQNATQYRQTIENARRMLDPDHRNANWDKMVVIGHSMGGLITHYSQCTEPWKMLKKAGIFSSKSMALLRGEYVDKPFPTDRKGYEPFRKDYFFRPVEAGMVVYMATPHRGAPVASYSMVNLLTRLVQLPQNILEEAYHLATLQQDVLFMNPGRLTDWFTSVNQLSPSSYSIRGLQGLQVRPAPTYSFIGNRGSRAPLAETSDGVVPYWSSHIPWGQETIVPTDHHVQDDKETAAALAELLKQHARRR